MEKAISVEDARKRLGDLLDGVRLKGNLYIISKKGKPAAAIVPLEVARRYEESKKALLSLIKEVHERNKNKKPEEIEALIDNAIKWARKTNVKH